MSLRRVGFTTFAASLLLALVSLVVGPKHLWSGVYCPGDYPTAITGVDLLSTSLHYSSRCGSGTIDGGLVVFLPIALLGLAVAAVGHVRESVGSE